MKTQTPGITPAPAHLKLPVWYQESADAYTHHIRDQNKGIIVCSFGQDSSGEAEEKARYFVEAVNSHASLVSRVTELEKALQKIADNYGGCRCDHTTEDCCELPEVGEFCPHCISEIALAKRAMEGKQ